MGSLWLSISRSQAGRDFSLDGVVDGSVVVVGVDYSVKVAMVCLVLTAGEKERTTFRRE